MNQGLGRERVFHRLLRDPIPRSSVLTYDCRLRASSLVSGRSLRLWNTL